MGCSLSQYIVPVNALKYAECHETSSATAERVDKNFP